MTTPGGHDYHLRHVSFPLSALGAVVLLDDGTYDVLLNRLVSDDMQRRALDH